MHLYKNTKHDFYVPQPTAEELENWMLQHTLDPANSTAQLQALKDQLDLHDTKNAQVFVN